MYYYTNNKNKKKLNNYQMQCHMPTVGLAVSVIGAGLVHVLMPTCGMMPFGTTRNGGTSLGTMCTPNGAVDDWMRVLTTSSGHVAAAPAVPAILE